MHRQAKVPLNHFMATLLVLMTVPCIPCTLLKPPVSNAVGCAKSHLLCTATDRKATNFICLTSRIAFICWDTTQFVPAHEFHFDCGFCLTVTKYLLIVKSVSQASHTNCQAVQASLLLIHGWNLLLSAHTMSHCRRASQDCFIALHSSLGLMTEPQQSRQITVSCAYQVGYMCNTHTCKLTQRDFFHNQFNVTATHQSKHK